MVPCRSGAEVEQITAAAFSNSARRAAADRRDHLRRVPRVVRLHQLEDGAWMLERFIDLRVTLGVEFIAPGRLVVGLLRLVPAGEQAFVERESFLESETTHWCAAFTYSR